MVDESWWLASYSPPMEGREPVLFQEIGQSEFDEAVTDALVITLFVHRHHYELVRSNYQAWLQNAEEARAHGLTDDATVADTRNRELKIALVNWLLGFRAFLDHLQTHLSELFGKDSREMQSFKALTSRLFDSHFGYRFLYRLRNFTQHCGFPPVWVRVDPNEAQNAFVGLERAPLLERSDVWGSIVGSELEAQQRLFPVEPLVEETMMCVDEINDAVRVLEKPRFEAAAVRMRSMKEAAEGHGGLPAVAHRSVEKDKIRVAIRQMPIRLLEGP